MQTENVDKAILVTGGAGYIGSHIALELLKIGKKVVILDNLCNSSRESVTRVEKLMGQSVTFIEGDICDSSLLQQTFAEHSIGAVIHLAGLKAVGESVRSPSLYYKNNVLGSLNLFAEMAKASVFKVIFSSSATVYGEVKKLPISEDTPTTMPINPYGKSKLMVEQILQDFHAANNQWSIGILRYFNPAGAHPSGLIGEDPNGIPNNLLPYISKVAVGQLEKLSIFGADYPTHDGTGIRDYIHVVDLAKGHIAALDYIDLHQSFNCWNLGTGKGYSVLEVIEAFEQVSQVRIPYDIVPRRVGDLAQCWSDPSRAEEELNWKADLELRDMMADSWKWQQNNPNGY